MLWSGYKLKNMIRTWITNGWLDAFSRGIFLNYLDTVAFNKVSYYTNTWWNNISKTVLIFKIGPEMTKLDFIWYIKIFTTKRVAVLTQADFTLWITTSP